MDKPPWPLLELVSLHDRQEQPRPLGRSGSERPLRRPCLSIAPKR